MSEHVVVIHLDRCEGSGPGGRAIQSNAAAAAAGACSGLVCGIQGTSIDTVTGDLLVRFDRARSTVADIVRCLEDHGVAISGVSQSPCEPASHAAQP